MKKFFYFPIFVIMIVVLAVACKKDTSCGALIRVYFSENGQDAEEPATDALVQIAPTQTTPSSRKLKGTQILTAFLSGLSSIRLRLI